VNEGEIFGLIGPDGAGKTTTFQIIAGVMEATSGAAEVFGRPARESAREGRFSMEDVFISVVEKAQQEGKAASED